MRLLSLSLHESLDSIEWGLSVFSKNEPLVLRLSHVGLEYTPHRATAISTMSN